MVSRPIPTVLVDNCCKFREGLKSLLDFHNMTSALQFQIVGQAASLQQALGVIHQQAPRLILLDIDLAQEIGGDILPRLKSLAKCSYVLIVSDRQDEEWVFKAMQAGVKGYIFKQNLSVQLLEAIQIVLRDQIYLPPEVATQFFQQFQVVTTRNLSSLHKVNLTERERDVLQWLAQGASNETIAKQLNITVGTVKAYLTTIFGKLEVNSRTQAVLQALKLGIVSS